MALRSSPSLVSADLSNLTFRDDLIYEQYFSSNTGSNTLGYFTSLEAFPPAVLHGIIFISHHNLPRKIYLSNTPQSHFLYEFFPLILLLIPP